MANKFKKEQRIVHSYIVVSFLISVTSRIFLADTLAGIDNTTDEEFVYFSAGFWLAATVLRAAVHRLLSPGDIQGMGMAAVPTTQMRILSAVLQNTLEQSVLLVIVSLLLISTDRERFGGVVRVNSCLFGIGRFLFVGVYHKGVGIGRALGFGLSFMPQMVALLGWAAYKVGFMR